ncbi:Inositol polyphosphate kinase family protein [Clavispora lusitaniae]|uniref:Kinase n=1 Tax=Clavispora lusitaniae (strain ATCC 42720) TaxID=306902 RepID=C4Y7J8_CLAL4|nr:uncharacterized protein CLUG_04176 [Clavispora lusitaniae ATCC 42720]EEQ40048.1 hypothetical protein CLUG_04176 [Clavispora lusitaniae ATCC 42720]KAF7581990.1 Inositol polyphosphate kinase family protein [Clavispora lusitaniae]
MSDPQADLSADLPPAAHQAAGHDGCLSSGPIFAKPSTSQEIDFYTQLAPHAFDHEPGSHLAHWMPTYMGLLASKDSPEPPFIVLQNLYHGMAKPCILDIKLGAVLVDDTVTEEKRRRLAQVSAETTSGSLHFRVCGMKVYCPDSAASPRDVLPSLADSITEEKHSDGAYLSFDKTFGRRLTPESVVSGIGAFFAPFPHRKRLYTRFHQRLQLLYNCLLDTEVRINSGSLLFLYDADESRWAGLDDDSYLDADPLLAEDEEDEDEEDEEDDDEDDDSKEKQSKYKGPLSRLKLIDFAHAKLVPGEGPDENVIVGIENLLNVFAQLINH